MICQKCGVSFECSGHCRYPKPVPTEKCICFDCDTADLEWKNKCQKKHEKEYNPSYRDNKGMIIVE